MSLDLQFRGILTILLYDIQDVKLYTDNNIINFNKLKKQINTVIWLDSFYGQM